MEHPMVGSSTPYAINNVTSIPTGLSAQWAYSPWFQGAWLLKQTRVVLTGKRSEDYLAAETATKRWHIPRVTVWHHIFDWSAETGKCTMQLVGWNIHCSTVPHAGGCWQYSQHYGPYKATRLNAGELQKLTEPEGVMRMPDPLQHSTKELKEFALTTGKKLSPELQQLFSGKRTLSEKGLAALVTEKDLFLDALLPLTDSLGYANGTAVLSCLKQDGMAQPIGANAMPIGVDPYGNVFWVGDDGMVYFYDHETDTYESTGQRLSDILA